MRIVILLVILLVFNTAAHSEVYKWIDQDGNTQYGDHPSTESDTTQVEINAGSGALQTTGEKEDTASALADELRERKIKRKSLEYESAMKQAEAKDNKVKCTDAKTRLKMLQEIRDLSNPSLPEGRGNFKNIADIKRKATIDEAKKDIVEFCI
jgi:hypothetical protein